MAQSLAQGAGKTLGRLAGVKLAGRLAKRGYGKAKN